MIDVNQNLIPRSKAFISNEMHTFGPASMWGVNNYFKPECLPLVQYRDNEVNLISSVDFTEQKTVSDSVSLMNIMPSNTSLTHDFLEHVDK